jgi:hypothetical protein
VIVALATGLMGILIGYAVVRGRKTHLAAVLEQGSFLPYLIPSIAFGAIYLALFSKSIGPMPPLYGTFSLLVLVCVAKNLPFSARSGISSMMQVAGELEEAAAVPADHSAPDAGRFDLGVHPGFHLHDAGAVADHPAHHARDKDPDDDDLPGCGTGIFAVRRCDHPSDRAPCRGRGVPRQTHRQKGDNMIWP